MRQHSAVPTTATPADLMVAHPHRVGALAIRLGTALGLWPQALTTLGVAAWLHDIGKSGLPDALLAKRRALTSCELALVRRHPLVGERLARAHHASRSVRLVVRHHHERWDGTGYPDGLRGEEIPPLARIIAIADAYDAMVSGRPYEKARCAADALAEITRCAGTQFDPRMAAVFCECMTRHRPTTASRTTRR